MASTDFFRHDRLDRTKTSIRLIKLVTSPETDPDGVCCEMWHQELSDDHTCLSYMWGDDEPKHRVYINGKSFYVRQNLYDFLFQARETFPGTPLWIDALCIDQDMYDPTSIAERNQQVHQMGPIYQRARLVVIWLGSDTELKRAALRAADTGVSHREAAYMDRRERIATPRQHKNGHCDIINHKYWSRVWILQEVLLARQLKVMAGKGIVHWESFLECYYSDIPDTIPSELAFTKPHLRSLIERAEYGAGHHNVRSPSFVPQHIWQESLVRHCHDYRDRIYGTLYLDKVLCKAITPDYTLDRAEFFFHCIKGLLSQIDVMAEECLCKSLEILARIVRSKEHLGHDSVLRWAQENPHNAILFEIPPGRKCSSLAPTLHSDVESFVIQADDAVCQRYRFVFAVDTSGSGTWVCTNVEKLLDRGIVQDCDWHAMPGLAEYVVVAIAGQHPKECGFYLLAPLLAGMFLDLSRLFSVCGYWKYRKPNSGLASMKWVKLSDDELRDLQARSHRSQGLIKGH